MIKPTMIFREFVVFRVSKAIAQLFESQLVYENIPNNQWVYFNKWLRYYLDFFQNIVFSTTIPSIMWGMAI